MPKSNEMLVFKTESSYVVLEKSTERVGPEYLNTVFDVIKLKGMVVLKPNFVKSIIFINWVGGVSCYYVTISN